MCDSARYSLLAAAKRTRWRGDGNFGRLHSNRPARCRRHQALRANAALYGASSRHRIRRHLDLDLLCSRQLRVLKLRAVTTTIGYPELASQHRDIDLYRDDYPKPYSDCTLLIVKSF